ncbi:hypothetical protein KSP40_PGU009666 [Platanthera guangdongensis]|uniref:Uncharacterized protein n=1 Tax=Platanthera guangdongensis TaxID=2320717 RepID=A0ABR2N3M9_9ASPA
MKEVENTIVQKTSCFEIKYGVPISNFDHSTENFLAIMDTILELSGGASEENFEASEIGRFKSLIVFLREWKQFFFSEWSPFHHKSKTVNFTYQTESTEEKHAINGIELPHFSSAAVPKLMEKLPCSSSTFDNDDFLLHVGGSVWSLDWCPSLHENTDGDVTCQYLAIATHPNGSEYHKIGEQLSGRGFIQIWCFLHLDDKEELLNSVQHCIEKGNKEVKDFYVPKKQRGRPRKTPVTKMPKPRGRPRKHPISSYKGCAITHNTCYLNEQEEVLICNDTLMHNEYSQIYTHDLMANGIQNHVEDCREIVVVTEKSVQEKSSISEGIALPKLILSLAHNGKVTWDMKWRPSDATHSNSRHHLGYLAVVLGDGSLEVWEVPVHGLVKHLYATCKKEGADPRFLKLQPVFRCSRIKFGDRQSIPLALEWSPSASRDLILAGCHDGTVALWKFASQLSSQDTKPLLCFTADTGPIRSLAWSPEDSDTECSNLIVTAGHDGLKFWDLRDPYRPLWEFSPVQRAVLGLAWLKDPRCIMSAYEDGSMRTLSLTKIANDTPVTGQPFSAKQPGVHCQSCSMFAIWSVHVSRSTGLAAYCSTDGCIRYFQLTSKAVDKDASRYRMPHFLCGSFFDEGPTLGINTPVATTPLPKQLSLASKATHEARRTDSSALVLYCPDNGASKNSHKTKKLKEDGKIASFPSKSVAVHKEPSTNVPDPAIRSQVEADQRLVGDVARSRGFCSLPAPRAKGGLPKRFQYSRRSPSLQGADPISLSSPPLGYPFQPAWHRWISEISRLSVAAAHRAQIPPDQFMWMIVVISICAELPISDQIKRRDSSSITEFPSLNAFQCCSCENHGIMVSGLGACMWSCQQTTFLRA